MQLDGLELIAELTSRFSKNMFVFYPQLVKAITPLLNSTRFSVCKRAIACLGYISVNCSNDMYDEILKILINRLDMEDINHYTAKVYISAITAICRNSGSRMVSFLSPIFSILLTKYVNIDDDELKEAYLTLFEIALRKCAKEMSDYIINVSIYSKIALQYLIYFVLQ